MKKVCVRIESMPSPPPPPGTILNSPCHSKGSFVIGWARPFESDDFKVLVKHMWKYTSYDLEEFDMFYSDPGWRINLDGMEKAVQLGYDININGKELAIDPSRPLIEDIIEHKSRLDLMNEYNTELRKLKGRIASVRERRENRKIDSWKEGLVFLSDDDAIENVEKKEVINQGKLYRGGWIHTYAKITFDFEGNRYDGFYSYYNGADMWVTSYYVPEEIANIVNERMALKEVRNPSRSLMNAIMEHEHPGTGFYIHESAVFDVVLSRPELIDEAKERFIEKAISTELSEEERDTWRCRVNDVLYDDEETLFDLLCIKNDVIEARRVKIQKWQELKDADEEEKRLEAERKERERQREMEERMRRREARESRVSALKDELGRDNTKKELLERYNHLLERGIIYKSWNKGKIAEAIARREASA